MTSSAPTQPPRPDGTLAAIIAYFPHAAALIWDFDGVLADTEPLQGHAYECVLSECGVAPPGGFFTKYVGTPEPLIWTGLIEEFGLTGEPSTLSTRRAHIYQQAARAQLRVAWYVTPLLNAATQHDLPSLIVSSGNHPIIHQLVEDWGLQESFAGIRALGSPESAPGSTKTQRLEAVLSQVGHTAKRPCIVIEDSPTYLRLAREQGCVTVGIQHSLNQIAAHQADIVVPINTPNWVCPYQV